MNIREKLLELRISVPEDAHRFRTGKGCLLWWPMEADDNVPSIGMLPVDREQYEALMCAGLAGTLARLFEAAYIAPALPSAPSKERRSPRC